MEEEEAFQEYRSLAKHCTTEIKHLAEDPTDEPWVSLFERQTSPVKHWNRYPPRCIFGVFGVIGCYPLSIQGSVILILASQLAFLSILDRF